MTLSAGDPAPWFVVPTSQRPDYMFSTLAGRYVLLAFPGAGASAGATEASLRAAARSGILNDDHVTAFMVLPGQPEGLPPPSCVGLRIGLDAGNFVATAYRACSPASEMREATYTPHLLLLDPLLRVITPYGIDDLQKVLSTLTELPPPGRYQGAEAPAPVLLLPRVLEPELCQALIDAYEAAGGSPSGFMEQEMERTVGTMDANRKRRSDYLMREPQLCQALRHRIEQRLVPEIHKAFQFRVSRIERYLVACYDAADAGFFFQHRDNTTRLTAHRRFAVTINLNDNFIGGALRFPEFSDREYCPPAGGAVVFSCSLLHEALPVTQGRRYAALPFLHDRPAEAVRQANLSTMPPA